ncbi:hypothetical protein ACFPIJ_62720 [Dactylosporangium cerinum]|uniref:Uncharacterized protein n=1 Tax=Dactylosporangium cerinum TaxID=1434730 RepID=A0ABV9WJW3_9ACTN
MNPTQKLATHDGVPLSEYLRGAATYLTTRGWVKRQLFVDLTGPFPPADIAGALIMATYGRMVDLSTSTDPADFTGPAHETWEAALLLLEDHLGLRAPRRAQHLMQPGDLLFGWNDEPGRTIAEVLSALRDTADIYDGAATVERARELAEKDPADWTDADLADWLGEQTDNDNSVPAQPVTYNPNTDRYETPDGQEDPGCRARRLIEESSPAALWGER